VLDTDPEAARQALRRINEASSTALDEIRTTLGLLRAGEPILPAVSAASVAEARDTIEGLISRARADGMPVELVISGTPRELPGVIRQTAYRVAQESLTNVVKHGREVSRVAVHLMYGPGQLRLEVANDGAAVQPRVGMGADAGHGITGMRERLAAVGGSLTAVPLREGGFRVTAIVPTEAP
jgi:signal transduction histidine kinase